MTDDKVFWMVYVEGLRAPEYQHFTHASAVVEAERLCRQENRRVFLLKADHFVSVSEAPIKWFMLKEMEKLMFKETEE